MAVEEYTSGSGVISATVPCLVYAWAIGAGASGQGFPAGIENRGTGGGGGGAAFARFVLNLGSTAAYSIGAGAAGNGGASAAGGDTTLVIPGRILRAGGAPGRLGGVASGGLLHFPGGDGGLGAAPGGSGGVAGAALGGAGGNGGFCGGGGAANPGLPTGTLVTAGAGGGYGSNPGVSYGAGGGGAYGDGSLSGGSGANGLLIVIKIKI